MSLTIGQGGNAQVAFSQKPELHQVSEIARTQAASAALVEENEITRKKVAYKSYKPEIEASKRNRDGGDPDPPRRLTSLVSLFYAAMEAMMENQKELLALDTNTALLFQSATLGEARQQKKNFDNQARFALTAGLVNMAIGFATGAIMGGTSARALSQMKGANNTLKLATSKASLNRLKANKAALPQAKANLRSATHSANAAKQADPQALRPQTKMAIARQKAAQTEVDQLQANLGRNNQNLTQAKANYQKAFQNASKDQRKTVGGMELDSDSLRRLNTQAEATLNNARNSAAAVQGFGQASTSIVGITSSVYQAKQLEEQGHAAINAAEQQIAAQQMSDAYSRRDKDIAAFNAIIQEVQQLLNMLRATANRASSV